MFRWGPWGSTDLALLQHRGRYDVLQVPERQAARPRPIMFALRRSYLPSEMGSGMEGRYLTWSRLLFGLCGRACLLGEDGRLRRSFRSRQ